MGVRIIIVISAMVSLAFGYDCDSEMDIAACGASLSGFSGDPAQLRQFCADAAAAEVCVDAVIAECPNLASSQTAQYMRMMQGQLFSICPSTGGVPEAAASSGCQAGYMGRIHRCSSQLQGLNVDPSRDDYQETCQRAMTAVECLEEVFSSCSGKQEVQGMMAFLNPATLRTMLGNCGQTQ